MSKSVPGQLTVLWITLLLSVMVPASALAQLSPGDLAEPHAELEGLANCVKCHKLGVGPSDRLCLDCHAEIDEGLKSRRGYHQLVTQGGEKSCPECHSDHNGREFELVFWPEGPDRFDHALTGYALDGAHSALKCRQCHLPKNIVRDPRRFRPEIDLERTYLGLGTRCLDCHADEHLGQLAEDCIRCHTLEKWKPVAGFDHERAKYHLTGLHRQVDCVKCHPTAPGDESRDGRPITRYTGLSYNACTPCHRDDVHKGRLGTRCEECHRTTGWLQQADRQGFDHARTIYPLEDRHAAVECRKCHTGSKLTQPIPHKYCADCHRDTHRKQFSERADGGRCESCHNLKGFIPPLYDIAEHQQSSYPLSGGHLAVPCQECHPQKTDLAGELFRIYRIAETSCDKCHQDEHRGQFVPQPGEQWCDKCHSTTDWRKVDIDHDRARFALTLSHTRVPCNKCHKTTDSGTSGEHVLYRPLELTCKGCHTDIHRGQFAGGERSKDCEICHTGAAWKELKFDHSRDSTFSLKGAHIKVACALCHKTDVQDETGESFVLYRHLKSECADCHLGSIDTLEPTTEESERP